MVSWCSSKMWSPTDIRVVAKASGDEKDKMKAVLQEYFTVEDWPDRKLSLVDMSALKKTSSGVC